MELALSRLFKIFGGIALTLLSVTGFAQCSVQAIVQHATCSGRADGRIQLRVSGASPFKFEWSNGFITQNIDKLSPGVYSVGVTDAKGSRTTATIEIKSQSDLTLSTKITKTSITATASGGKAPYRYSLSSISVPGKLIKPENQSGSFTNLLAGEYAIVIRDANGCSVIEEVVLAK